MHTGSCRCGSVEVSFDGDPKWIANCHCAECRKSTGSVYATYVGCTEEQAQVRGPAQSYDSSPGVSRLFCGTCGSPIAYRGERWPGEIHFFVGLFEDAATLAPRAEVYFREALPWVDECASLPRFPGVPRDGRQE